MHKLKYFQNEFPSTNASLKLAIKTPRRGLKSCFGVLLLNLRNTRKYGNPELRKLKRVKQSEITINSNKNIFDKITKFKIFYAEAIARTAVLFNRRQGFSRLPQHVRWSSLWYLLMASSRQKMSQRTPSLMLREF